MVTGHMAKLSALCELEAVLIAAHTAPSSLYELIIALTIPDRLSSLLYDKVTL